MKYKYTGEPCRKRIFGKSYSLKKGDEYEFASDPGEPFKLVTPPQKKAVKESEVG